MKEYIATKILLLSMATWGLFFTSSCVFIRPSSSKQFSQAKKSGPYDAIIVPGIPFDGSKGKWNSLMKMRVYWSVYLYKQGLAKNIIYSGSAVYTPYCESKIMSLYAEAMGVPKDHIFIDSSAEHSTENVYYSYYIARKQGFETVAIATDPFQSHFLRNYPEKINVNVHFVPIVFKTLFSLNMRDIEINPESAYVENFVSLQKRESFGKRLQGTRGKNIKRFFDPIDVDTIIDGKTALNFSSEILNKD